MESPTPLASCPPCSDTPLAITTSVITFLTFLYALTVGLIYCYGLAKSSPKEIQKFIGALSGSLGELETMGLEMKLMFAEESGTYNAEDDLSRQMRPELEAILGKLQDQVISLQHFGGRIRYYSSRSARWFKPVRRMYYLTIREELQQKVVDKDRLMEDLRQIHRRAEKITNDKVEKALWKEHHEMLTLIRAERAEDTKSQEIYWKEQGAMQVKQLQMLESILRRVIRLEASEKTTTQGETSSTDPPPESPN